MNLAGTFTVSDLGLFNRTGSNTVNITGTLENAAPPPLTLDAATDWRLNGGRINGGVVDGEGTLTIWSNSTLDGVTLEADASLSRWPDPDCGERLDPEWEIDADSQWLL